MTRTPPTVLLVDDRPNMLELLSKVLRHDARVLRARGAGEAKEILAREPVSVVVSDLRMPDGDGLSVLDAMRRLRPYAAFILITAHASVDSAVEAMRRGAYDYLTKPFEPDHVRALVLRALGKGEGEADAPELPPVEPLPGIVGASASMQALARLARDAAQDRAPLLLTGEQGCGRGVLARAIHTLGAEGEQAFVEHDALESSAQELVSRLLESNFASTATHLVRGLDEIDPEQSAALTRHFSSAGDPARHARLMVVGTVAKDQAPVLPSWRELRALHVPALRERVGDVSRLANHFLGRVVAEEGPLGFTATAMEMLERHEWPGNVRELAEAVRVASILAPGRRIDVADLPETIRAATDKDEALSLLSYQQAVDLARAEATKRYLEAVLRRTGGVVTSAAEIAGIERESFYRLLRKHGVDVDDFRGKRGSDD